MNIQYNNSLQKILNKVNMEICDIGYARLNTDWHAENVCSTIFRVYMPTQGSGIIKSASENLTMLPYNIYIIPSYYEFSYKCEDYLEKLYFHINVTRPDNYDIFKGATHSLVLENRRETIRTLLELFYESNLSGVIKIKTILYELVCEAFEVCSKNENIKYSALVERAIAFIDDNLSAALCIRDIADGLFVSPSKLQKSFKQETTVSIGKYIDDRIMYTAEREIRKGELSLKEISDSLGFCDQFYFSRKFSDYYGSAPLKYKKYLT